MLLEKARVKKLEDLIASLEVLGEPTSSSPSSKGLTGTSQKGEKDDGTVEDTPGQGLGDTNTGEGDSQDPPKKSSPVVYTSLQYIDNTPYQHVANTPLQYNIANTPFQHFFANTAYQ